MRAGARLRQYLHLLLFAPFSGDVLPVCDRRDHDDQAGGAHPDAGHLSDVYGRPMVLLSEHVERIVPGETSLDLEVTGVNEFILSYLLQSNFSVFSRLYDTLTEMMQQPNPSQDLKTALDKLLNLQQSRHYFLASVAIQ